MKKFLAGLGLLAALALPANADVVLGGQNWSFNGVDNLTLTPVVPSGNQPQNIQCIICGDNQPQQNATFGYTNYQNNGGLTEGRFFSTNVSGGANPGQDTVGLGYNIGFLQNFIGGNLNFSVGIDVNDNNTPQSLNSFFMLNLTTHTVLAAFTGGPVPLVNVNNGTGFPDFTLTGFNINLGTDIHAGDQIVFFERMTNLSDGPDSFFIVPNVAVPGPIVGAGLPGLIAACGFLLGLARYRRTRRSA